MAEHEKAFKESIEGGDYFRDWVTEEIDHLQWVLTRPDDNGFEVEMFRFHQESDAKRVREKYQDRGHKQLYLVHKITRTRKERYHFQTGATIKDCPYKNNQYCRGNPLWLPKKMVGMGIFV